MDGRVDRDRDVDNESHRDRGSRSGRGGEQGGDRIPGQSQRDPNPDTSSETPDKWPKPRASKSDFFLREQTGGPNSEGF